MTCPQQDDARRNGYAVQFSCPHCKRSIEAASIEAGSKKACPGCGQRVSVPSSSPSGEMKPISSPPASSAAGPETSAADDGRATPAGSRNLLIGGGIVAAGLVVLVLLACMFFAFSGGGGDRQALMKAQKELEAKAAEQEKIDAEAKLEYQLAVAKKIAEDAEQKRPQDKDDEKKDKTVAVNPTEKKVDPVEPLPGFGTVVVLAAVDGPPVFAKLGQTIGTVLDHRTKRAYPLKFGPQPLPPGDYVVVGLKKLKGAPVPPHAEPNTFTLNSRATVELLIGFTKK